MADTPETPGRRGIPLVYAVLVVLTLALTAVLVNGFWGDHEEANDLTRRQADISHLETGPGAPAP